MVEDLQAKVRSQRSVLEKIMGYVPLYHGYKEKELRRESDRILRKHIFEILDNAKRNLKKSQTGLVENDKIEYAQKTDKLITICETLSQRINHAESGYSGFWDAVKIKEDHLDRLYEIDSEIATASEDIKNFIETLPSQIAEDNAISENYSKINGKLEALDKILSKRHEFLRGVNVDG